MLGKRVWIAKAQARTIRECSCPKGPISKLGWFCLRTVLFGPPDKPVKWRFLSSQGSDP